MFLAWKEIKKEKTRFIMIILVTTLIAYLVYFLTGLAFGLASSNTTAVNQWGSKGVILSKSSNDNIYASEISQEKVNQLALKKYEPLNIASTVISINKSDNQFDLVLMGTHYNSELIPKLVEGEKVSQDDEIVLSKSFKKNADVEIGDTVEVVSTNRTFKVVGFTEIADYNTRPVGYVSLDMASRQTMSEDSKKDFMSSEDTFSALIVNQIVDRNNLDNEDLVYLPMKDFKNAIPGYKAQNLTFGLMIISLIIISSVIISIFMYIITMQKKSLFAVLKVQGINNGYVSRSVVYQTLIVIFFGIILGNILTSLTFLFLPPVVPVLINCPLTVLISLLFILSSLLGSLFSARSILKIDPLDAL